MRLILILSLLGALFLTSCNAIRSTVNATGRNISGMFISPEKIPVKISNPSRTDAGLAVLWIGHATCLIQIDDKFILTDPNLTSTVGQFSKRKIEPGIDYKNLPHLDLVLISHMHIDHLSPGSLDLIKDKIDNLLVPQQGLVYIPDFDFGMSELPLGKTWEKDGLQVTAVPSIHNGWRYGVDGDWMKKSYTGYIIKYNGKTVYFAGDTAYDSTNFVEIGHKFPQIDLALVPIAPINPREFSGLRHTDPIEAVKIYRDLNARFLIPMHYGTFPESLDEPGEAIAKMNQAMQENGLSTDQVKILSIGEQKILLTNNSLHLK